jgi:hypothetical protein
MMSALVVLGAVTLLENTSLRKSGKPERAWPNQSRCPHPRLDARFRNSTKATLRMKANLNVDNSNMTIKPDNR